MTMSLILLFFFLEVFPKPFSWRIQRIKELLPAWCVEAILEGGYRPRVVISKINSTQRKRWILEQMGQEILSWNVKISSSISAQQILMLLSLVLYENLLSRYCVGVGVIVLEFRKE